MYMVDLRWGVVNVATQVRGRGKKEKNAEVFYSRGDDVDLIQTW